MRWLIRSFITIVVAIPFFFHLYSEKGFDFLNAMEFWAYDTRMLLTMPNTTDAGIVIIDIDEKSMLEFGQWPWPRDVLAELVDVLFDHYKIKVLGFDMQFPEPDRHDDLDLISELERNIQDAALISQLNLAQLRAERDRDQIFADSIKDRAVVLGFTMIAQAYEVGALPRPILNLDKNPEFANLPFLELPGYIGNFELLQNTGVSGGNFNPLTIDSDGKIRGIAMLSKQDNKVYESLSMAIARKALGIESIGFATDMYNTDEINANNVASIIMHDTEYFVGDGMEMLIPYRGSEGTFNYYSAADIINKKIDANTLNNVVVLVGSRASGLRDLRVAPISENFPGVEMNANMVSGIILNTVKHRPEFAYVMEMALVLVIGILFTALLPRLPVLYGAIFTVAIVMALWLGNMAMWNNNEVMPVATSFSFIVALYMAHLLYGSFIETRRKQQLTKLFGQYVPPELVDEMESDLSHYSMDTQDAELSVLFVDIRDFTSLSESLSAEQVTQVLNEFLTSMTDVIHAKRGTIDKYMGDAIMAFWGAPLPNQDHAQDAVSAAFLMQENMNVLNEKLAQQGLPNINICIGINTGVMRVGNMGSEFRMAYTVVGDAVNLASRLEALTRNYAVGIMLGENTQAAISNIACLELDKVRVKGKDNPVSVFVPIGDLDAISEAQTRLLTQHHSALNAYRAQDWLSAKSIFNRLAEQYPELALFTIYLERINAFMQKAPDKNWEGIYTYTND